MENHIWFRLVIFWGGVGVAMVLVQCVCMCVCFLFYVSGALRTADAYSIAILRANMEFWDIV